MEDGEQFVMTTLISVMDKLFAVSSTRVTSQELPTQWNSQLALMINQFGWMKYSVQEMRDG